MRKGIRIAALLLAVLCCLPFAGCGSASAKVKADRVATRVVATAGGVDIYYDELYYLAMNRIRERREELGEGALESAGEREALAAFVRENLMSKTHALISVGYDYGIDLTKGDIADEVQSEMDDILKNTFGDDRKAYIRSLNGDYLTDRYVRQYIGAEEFLATEIILAMLEKGEIDDLEETANRVIRSDDMIRTVQVFLDKSDAANTRELAESIRAEIAAAESDDARYDAMRRAIAGKYNDDFADVGNGYYFLRGEMDAAYEKAAFKLANYEVSGVVETGNGYYIIMRLPKSEEYITSHYQELKEKSYIVQLNQKVDERFAGMHLEMTKFGASLDVCSLPSLDAGGRDGTPVWLIVVISVAGVALVGGVVYLIRKKTGKGAAKKKK